MGKLSPEKQAQLDALTAERDAVDEDDDYAWVRLENGATVRLHGKRLADYLRKHGLDADDVEDSSKADPVDPDDAGAGKPAKKVAPAKKVPGKKIAPNAAGGTADDGDGELEVEPDEQPAQRRPVFF